MRRPLSPAPAQTIVRGSLYPISAPILGLNLKDAVADVSDKYALQLDNLICQVSKLVSRAGAEDHVTGFPLDETVQSLIPYRRGNTVKLFAGTQEGVYEVTSAGTVGAKVFSASGGHWLSFNSANPTSRYLVALNGEDTSVKLYDGTSWTDAVFTGLTPGTIFTNLTQSKTRIYFTAKNSLSFWYLGVNSIQGAIEEFDLGAIFTLGGNLQAIGAWTPDGGSDIRGYTVFLTSEGEVAIYDGYDPTDAANWQLVNVYTIPKPIGQKCLLPMGGDLLVLTQAGIVSLSKALAAVANDQTLTISDKIAGGYLQYVSAFSSLHGWEMCHWAKGNILLINIPTSSSTAIQYVWELSTKAWSRFIGWQASCFTELSGDLYFGTGQKVAKAFTGQSDFGMNIPIRVKTSYSYLGSRSNKKLIQMFQPNFRLSGNPKIGFAFSTDFQNDPSVDPAPSNTNGVAVWDDSLWDQAFWADDFYVDQGWRTVGHLPAMKIATLFAVNAKDYSLEWNSIAYKVEYGLFF